MTIYSFQVEDSWLNFSDSFTANTLAVAAAGVGSPQLTSGTQLTAPVITSVIPVTTTNPVFAVSNNGTILSNHNVVQGNSAYTGASVGVYLNGALEGTTTTSGTGAWSFDLGAQSDGNYTVNAAVTAGGSSSAQSSNFNFTIAPLLTNLGVAIGQNIPPTISNPSSLINIGPDVYEVQNASTNSSATIPSDTHTLVFNLGPNDNWNGFNRDEVSSHTNIQNGQVINITYAMMLSAADPQSDQEMLLGQIHENNTTSTTPVLFGMAIWPQRPDSPTWQYNNGGPGSNQYTFIQNQASGSPFPPTGLGALTRGVFHTFDIIIKPISGGGGTLDLWVDGVKYIGSGTTAPVTNLQGSGGSNATPYYWKFGAYRGTFGTPTQDQSQSVTYANMLVKLT